MGSKGNAVFALFLCLNLLFFVLVSAVKSPPPSAVKSPPPSVPKETCPRDALKLGVCVDLLHGLIGAVIGAPLKTPCCTLLAGLADLEAAVCLCTAIKADILGINLSISASVTILLNVCNKEVPPGFQCA